VRTCGACGEPGHNKRTCKTATITPPILAATIVAEPAGPVSGVDAETQEAIDWYLALCHPDWPTGPEARAARMFQRGGVLPTEDEEDEHDTD